MSSTIIVVGAGGHGRVVTDALLRAGISVLGFVDTDRGKWGTRIAGLRVLGGEDVLAEFEHEHLRLANGIGSTTDLQARRDVFLRLRDAGYVFATIIHPAATVAPSAQLEEGSQVMAGAVVQPDARIGVNSIINTGALIDHDCQIGDHCHVAPGCTLSGGVIIGSETHIGTAAVAIQGVVIGSGVVVAAGSVVVEAVADGDWVMGVPARKRKL